MPDGGVVPLGQDGLRQATDFERECQDLFAGLAAKAGHPLLARACAAFAVPAIAHRVRLEKELADLEELGRWEPAPEVPPSLEGRIRDLLAQSGSVRDDGHPAADGLTEQDRQRIAQGAEAARRGAALYEELTRRSADQTERAFFAALHREALDLLAALETLKKAAGQPRGAPPSRPGHSAPPR